MPTQPNSFAPKLAVPQGATPGRFVQPPPSNGWLILHVIHLNSDTRCFFHLECLSVHVNGVCVFRLLIQLGIVELGWVSVLVFQSRDPNLLNFTLVCSTL